VRRCAADSAATMVHGQKTPHARHKTHRVLGIQNIIISISARGRTKKKRWSRAESAGSTHIRVFSLGCCVFAPSAKPHRGKAGRSLRNQLMLMPKKIAGVCAPTQRYVCVPVSRDRAVDSSAPAAPHCTLRGRSKEHERRLPLLHTHTPTHMVSSLH
jgi:hypothetical protein